MKTSFRNKIGKIELSCNGSKVPERSREETQMRQYGHGICRTIITPWKYPSPYSQSLWYSWPHAESAPDHPKDEDPWLFFPEEASRPRVPHSSGTWAPLPKAVGSNQSKSIQSIGSLAHWIHWQSSQAPLWLYLEVGQGQVYGQRGTENQVNDKPPKMSGRELLSLTVPEHLLQQEYWATLSPHTAL